MGALELAPRDPARGIAVVFPPWISNRDATSRAAAAGATLLRMGRYSFIVIVRPWSPAYIQRVHAAGALAILESQAPGCANGRGSI